MTVEELIVYGKSKISSTHAKMLLAILLDVNSLELLTMLDSVVSDEIVQDYKEKVQKIRDNQPIQYVVGTVNFYGNIFRVNPNVLIPRFETEELVENVLSYIRYEFSDAKRVIDLGCGSGAIGLTIKKKCPELDVTLLDISPLALEVAKENAASLELDVCFIQSDMWSEVDEKYDIIISNPPYIRNDEEIQDIVRDNEPALALYGGADGLDCYRKIRERLLEHTCNQFLLAMEIGDLQKDAVVSLFSDIPNVQIVAKKDLQGRDPVSYTHLTLPTIA